MKRKSRRILSTIEDEWKVMWMHKCIILLTGTPFSAGEETVFRSISKQFPQEAGINSLTHLILYSLCPLIQSTLTTTSGCVRDTLLGCSCAVLSTWSTEIIFKLSSSPAVSLSVLVEPWRAEISRLNWLFDAAKKTHNRQNFFRVLFHREVTGLSLADDGAFGNCQMETS